MRFQHKTVALPVPVPVRVPSAKQTCYDFLYVLYYESRMECMLLHAITLCARFVRVLAKPWPSQWCSDKLLKLKGPPKLYWMTTSSTEKVQRKIVAFPYFSLNKFGVNVQFLWMLVGQFPTTCVNAPGCPANSSSLNVITALFRRQLNKPSGQSEVMKKMKTLSHMWRYTTHLGI